MTTSDPISTGGSGDPSGARSGRGCAPFGLCALALAIASFVALRNEIWSYVAAFIHVCSLGVILRNVADRVGDSRPTAARIVLLAALLGLPVLVFVEWHFGVFVSASTGRFGLFVAVVFSLGMSFDKWARRRREDRDTR